MCDILQNDSDGRVQKKSFFKKDFSVVFTPFLSVILCASAIKFEYILSHLR